MVYSIKGKENNASNALRRRPRFFSTLSLKIDLRSHILNHLIRESQYQQIIGFLQGVLVISKGDECTLENEVLLQYRGNMYVPSNENIWIFIIEEGHQAPYVAHPLVKKMYADLKRIFIWIGMKKDIRQFMV